jgi:hypothetical protein
MKYKAVYKPTIIIDEMIDAETEEEAAQIFADMIEEKYHKALWNASMIVDEHVSAEFEVKEAYV